jgi:hypothetical protein
MASRGCWDPARSPNRWRRNSPRTAWRRRESRTNSRRGQGILGPTEKVSAPGIEARALNCAHSTKATERSSARWTLNILWDFRGLQTPVALDGAHWTIAGGADGTRTRGFRLINQQVTDIPEVPFPCGPPESPIWSLERSLERQLRIDPSTPKPIVAGLMKSIRRRLGEGYESRCQ